MHRLIGNILAAALCGCFALYLAFSSFRQSAYAQAPRPFIENREQTVLFANR